MAPTYYALRLVNPFRGVLQIVDLGASLAQSRDGRVWYLKMDDGQGRQRQAGVWDEERGLLLGQQQPLQSVINAIKERPQLPFAMADDWECWLLDQEQGRPLALLATDRLEPDRRRLPDPDWQPFLPSYTGFSSLLLVERDALTPYAGQSHREVLARLVNRAARPQPRVQWFLRDRYGAGESAHGLRVPPEWRERKLTSEDFPELLVREKWNSRLETSVIADYHAHLSALLLLWPRLTTETRSRLELLACERPSWLARVQHLLTVQTHPQQLRAALVAARLSQASGEDKQPWIED